MAVKQVTVQTHLAALVVIAMLAPTGAMAACTAAKDLVLNQEPVPGTGNVIDITTMNLREADNDVRGDTSRRLWVDDALLDDTNRRMQLDVTHSYHNVPVGPNMPTWNVTIADFCPCSVVYNLRLLCAGFSQDWVDPETLRVDSDGTCLVNHGAPAFLPRASTPLSFTYANGDGDPTPLSVASADFLSINNC